MRLCVCLCVCVCLRALGVAAVSSKKLQLTGSSRDYNSTHQLRLQRPDKDLVIKPKWLHRYPSIK